VPPGPGIDLSTMRKEATKVTTENEENGNWRKDIKIMYIYDINSVPYQIPVRTHQHQL
jgi:hypothetical protein